MRIQSLHPFLSRPVSRHRAPPAPRPTLRALAGTALVALTALSLPAQASCFWSTAKSYSGAVGLLVGASGLIRTPTGEAVRVGVTAGTAVGELIDYGISHWWDPSLELVPDDPSQVVTDPAQSLVQSAITSLLSDFRGSAPYATTWADLQALNATEAGFGDAMTTMLSSGVSAFVHIAQGEAAYTAFGRGSAQVLAAAARVNDDLQRFSTAQSDLVPYLAPFDGTPGFPTVTKASYQSFLDGILSRGAAGLPPGEVSAGQRLLSLAGVHFVPGKALDSSLVTYLSAGDTGNEMAQIPDAGIGLSGLIAARAPGFAGDCCTCGDFCLPEPASVALVLTGVTGLGLQRRRRAIDDLPSAA